MRDFTRQLLAALAVHLLFVLIFFRSTLNTGGVASFQGKPAPPEALSGMSEMVYQLEPALVTQARYIRSGIFPFWSPYSQGGTPLIGKMQNGVFAPFHLPLYLLPLKFLGYSFMLVVILKSYLTFLFCYLFARYVGLKHWSAIFAGECFVHCHMMDGLLFGWASSGVYFPLALLLVELLLKDYRRFALFLLPWALGLPFLSGYFESAFRSDLALGIYFLLRLRAQNQWTKDAKLQRLGLFTAACLGGLAVAAVQLFPAMEYVNHSFNSIWHRFFGFWDYETISKHLVSDDLPMLLLGLLGLGASAFAFRRSAKPKNPPYSFIEWAWKGAAAGSLALGLAALANLGLDDSLSNMMPLRGLSETWRLPALIVLVFLAFRGWSEEERPELRTLGWLAAANLTTLLKAPPVSNALLHLPLFINFHNAGHRLEFDLAVALLSMAALERGKAALASTVLPAAFLLGCLGSRPLKPLLLSAVGTGVYHKPSDPVVGGIMGPEHVLTHETRFRVSGWLPALRAIGALRVAMAEEGGAAKADVDGLPGLKLSGDKLYFDAALTIPEGAGGTLWSAAFVKFKDGGEQVLRGGRFEVLGRGAPWAALGGAVAACALVPLAPPALTMLLGAGIALAAAWQFPIPGIDPGQVPYRLPGAEKLLEDKGLWRLSAVRQDFLPADYPAVYGISDIRTGGDNLDLLPMIFFRDLTLNFLSNAGQPAALTMGRKLLGLANVKYLAAPPGEKPPGEGLEPFYQGPDLSIFKNKYFMPRAAFFDKYQVLPLGDFTDWASRGRFLGPIFGGLAQGQLDLTDTLLLHDAPSGSPPPYPAGSPRPEVHVEEYAPARARLTVDSDRPGFVFFSDSLYPGWDAFRNGEPVPILRSWLSFRAVQVPKGRSEIVFEYRPWLLWLAALAGAAFSLGWAFAYRGYRRARTALVEAAAPAPQKKKAKPAPAPAADPLAEDCARAAEACFLIVIMSGLAFWTLWAACIYSGGLWIRLPAWAALAAAGLGMIPRKAAGPPAPAQP